MSEALIQAARIRLPYDGDETATANNFGCLKIAATTTHSASGALPGSWRGRFIKVRPVGGNLHIGCSKSNTAEIDRAVSATTAGASDKVGEYIPDGEVQHFTLPDWPAQSNLYLIVEADASTTVYVSLASRSWLTVVRETAVALRGAER
jgi:hypothetical protein